MYLDKPHSRQWLLDIEADGLIPTIIWCLCAINIGTGEEVTLTDPDEIRNWINDRLKEGCIFIGHNLLSYDVPNLNRILGTRIPNSRVVDTFLLSMVYSPNLVGGHSLEAWGLRLGFPKTHFNDWSKLSDEMVRYCLNDCRVNVRLFVRLVQRMVDVGISERCCEIEHKAWVIIRQQRLNGFYLDIPRAHQLYAEIRQLEKQIKEEIYHEWPPVLCRIATYSKAHKADGSYTANYQRHCEQFPRVEISSDGTYSVYDYVEFNLGSPKQRVEKLLEAGWKPREFTEKGTPQLTRKGHLVPSAQEFAEKTDNKAVQLLAEWIAINARGNMIGTWIDIADEKGLIHGNLWLAGSFRYRHDNPNTANIPAVRIDDDKKPILGRAGVFTYEARDLWCTRDPSKRSLVGVDAKGIQLRVLAHYLNNPEFTKQLLEGDPHEYNRQLAGIDTRPKAKTFIYAFLLGAGDAKVGEIIGGNSRQGAEVKDRFINNFPGLKQLLKRLATEHDRTGRITLCDGGKVLVPSPHAVLGYLLQGDESRIMKQAKIYVNEQIRKEKLDVLFVGDIHDEWQSDVLNEHIERFIEICVDCFERAGRSFNYRIPIECDSKVGKTWAETH
jgi:DNA polymerase-1